MSLVKRRWRISRDTVLFTAGLAGVIHEALIGQGERPTLLLLFAAMMGLPAFLERDEKHQPVPLQKEEQDGGEDVHV